MLEQARRTRYPENSKNGNQHAGGADAALTTPAEFGTLIADEVAKWKAVRDKAGIEPQ